ncbi:MAG TPA: hypothetical protein PKL16_12135, partial [Anaerolineae bacterium]|nr:hypothetical protein [Anaerolineae bacterium]HOS80826.1 hypothetical protein [Anaerolineae bacterium]
MNVNDSLTRFLAFSPIFAGDARCWRTSSKNENVWSLLSLAPGGQTAMDEPLWPVAFAPPPA